MYGRPFCAIQPQNYEIYPKQRFVCTLFWQTAPTFYALPRRPIRDFRIFTQIFSLAREIFLPRDVIKKRAVRLTNVKVKKTE